MLKKMFCLMGLISFLCALEYEDYFGKHLIDTHPKKVIYLNAYVEVPAMLGIWDRVVGVSSYAFEDDIVQKTAPLHQIDKFPTDHYASIDIEYLKKKQIELVITYPANFQSIEFAKRFGIKFLALRTQSMEDLFTHLRTQAKIFDKQDQSEQKFAFMQETLDLINDRTSGIEKKKVVEIFSKLNQVSGKHSMDSAILKSAGVQNIGLKYITQGRGEINLENLIKENPEVIFLWWRSPYSVEDILKQPQLQTVSAVQNKQVYKLPAMDIAGPRTPLICLFIAMKTYPEQFYDIDYDSFVQEYYHKIFGLP